MSESEVSESKVSESEDWDSDAEEELSGKYGEGFGSTIRKLEFTGDSQAMAMLKDQLSRFADDPKEYKFLDNERKKLVRQIHVLKKREDLAEKNYEKKQFRLWWYQVWERSDGNRRNSFRSELKELRAKIERGESLDSYENFRLQILDQLINFLDKEGNKEEIMEAWLNLGQRKMKTRARQRAKAKRAGKIPGNKYPPRGKKNLVDLRF